VTDGTCTACNTELTSGCTQVACNSNKFNMNGNAVDGCETGCGSVVSGTCTACTSSLASGCTAVSCDVNKVNTDGDATNGCEADSACPDGQWLNSGSCENCAIVSDSSARTCNAAGTAGIQTVACNTGFYETGTAYNDLGCTACTNQANCAVSTPNQCSTSPGITTNTPCTSVTAAGYYLDGDVVKTCAAVADTSARTCNAGGASGIQSVTCNTGFHESGSAGSNLGCTACADQANCAVSTPNQCSTSAGITTNTPCTSVTAAGYYLDGDVVKTCATVSDASARTCNAGGASGIQSVTCNTGFHESGSAGINLGCTACADQANCAVSTPNQCSTSAGITTNTPCTSVTAAGYYLDGDVVKTCATVSDASARTCNAGGASGIQSVTCNSGFYQTGSAGNNLGCTLCATVRGGTCTACTDGTASSCTAVTCNPNMFNNDNDATNGCEVGDGCGVIPHATCTACSSAAPSDCTQLTCNVNRFDGDGNAPNGCEMGCSSVPGGTCFFCY
jgi:hypothetical protein